MSEPTPSNTSTYPAITGLLASLRLGDPRVHNGIGLWPVFAECRPEPVYSLGQGHHPSEPPLRRRRDWI